MDYAAGLTVRRAVLADSAAIAAVFGAAWSARLSMVPKMHTAAEDLVYFASVVREQDVYVIDTDDAPRGFMALTAGWIDHLYVHPDYQGRGIGSALLTHAKSLQRQLTLWTFRANTNARRFYEKHGFTVVEFTDGSANEERTPDVRYIFKRSS